MSVRRKELEAKLATLTEGRERADVLVDLASEVLNTDVHYSMSIAREAASLAEKLEYRRGLAGAWNMLAAAYYRLSEYTAAIETSGAVLKLCEQHEDYESTSFALNTIGATSIRLGDYTRALESFLDSLAMRERYGKAADVATSLMNIGNVYHGLGDNAQALDYYLKSLSIRRQIGDKARIGTSLSNIGTIFSEIGDHDQALEYFHDSLTLKEESENRLGMVSTINSIAEEYLAKNDLENALLYARRSLELAQELGNKFGQRMALYDIGNILHKMQRDEEALQHYRESLKLAEEIGNRSGEAESLRAIGIIFSQTGNSRAAREYLFRALDIAQRIESKKLQYECYQSLAEVFAGQGVFDKAYYYLQEFYTLREKTLNTDAQKKVSKMQVIQQIEQSQKEAELYRKRMEELARLNRTLQELHAEKDEFVGIAAHDLRNPLSGIVMAADVLENHADHLSSGDIKRRVGSIKTAAERMTTIISGLLDIHAIESGTIAIHYQRFGVNEVLGQLLREYEEHARKKDISLVCLPAAQEVQMRSDKDKVYRILDNLVSNALKFSSGGTVVEIRVSTNAAAVCYEVHDQGPGISAEDQKRLFTKYARLSAQPTAGEHSTGLGLSIARKLAELLHGSIDYESQVGKGTRFNVTLPIV